MRRIKSIMRGSWPLAIVMLMVTIFLAQIEYATYYNYTFQIIGRKGELKVISGLSHVGEAIKIQNGKITIRENQYLYTIKDKGQNSTVEFIMPGGRQFSANFYGSATSHVKFHNASIDILHFSSFPASDDHLQQLLISSILVYLRTAELYKAVEIYMIVYLVTFLVGYCLYLRPLKMYMVYCRIFKKESERINPISIKITGVLFIVLGALSIFLML